MWVQVPPLPFWHNLLLRGKMASKKRTEKVEEVAPDVVVPEADAVIEEVETQEEVAPSTSEPEIPEATVTPVEPVPEPIPEPSPVAPIDATHPDFPDATEKLRRRQGVTL